MSTVIETPLIIITNVAAVLGFNQSSYIVAEETGNSTVDVCVYLMSGIIAPDVYVSYSIEFDVTNVTQGLVLTHLSNVLLYHL